MTTILLVSSNGVGLGHVTRLMALGRRLPEVGARGVLLTLSPAVAHLRGHGVLLEYLPSHEHSPLAPPHWHRLLADRVGECVALHGASAVVFDGAVAYPGLLAAARDIDVPFVWCRRGGRRQERRRLDPQEADAFALIVEPGEAGGEATAAPDGVVRVPPVLWHDASDLLPAPAARDALALPREARCALLQLGTGADGPLADAERVAVTWLRAQGITPVVARSVLRPELPGPDGALVRRRYPLAPYLAAFDLAVLAGGYNAVHEALACQVPAVVLPHPGTATDDQVARAVAATRLSPRVRVCAAPTAAALAEAAAPLLAGPPPPGTPPRNGAAELATRIVELTR